VPEEETKGSPIKGVVKKKHFPEQKRPRASVCHLMLHLSGKPFQKRPVIPVVLLNPLQPVLPEVKRR
jgi:hypothetical protein